jgi:signal transduction histidine kinase
VSNPGSSLPEPDYPAILSAASHDLRSPLATIYGFARTIERIAPLEGPAAGFLQHILEGARDLDRGLGHLSLLGRIGDGRFDPTAGPVDTSALAHGVVTAGAAEAGGPAEAGTVLAAHAEAVEALALLAEAVARLDPERATMTVRAVADGVELAPVGETVAPLLGAAADARDLALATALQALRALGASLHVDGGAARVTFPAD